MHRKFFYLGLALVLIGAALGIYWINSSLSQNYVAYGMALPIQQGGVQTGGDGLYFYDPLVNGTTTFTLSYQYADANASVTLWRCTITGPGCATSAVHPPVGPLTMTSGGTILHGVNGIGQYSEPTVWEPGVTGYVGGNSSTTKVGSVIDYAVETNEPVVAVVQVPQSAESLGIEYSAVGLLVAGVGLTITSIFLRDPNQRPSPRIAQLKRTLYFFFQNKLAVLGLAILVFFVVIAIIAPLLAPYQPSWYTPTDPNSANGAFNTLPQYCVIGAGDYGFPSCPSPQPVCNPDGTPASLVGQCTTGDVLHAASPYYGNIIGPTWNFSSILNPGAMPLGTLVTDKGQAGLGYMINIYQGLIRATPWDLALSSIIVAFGATIGIILGSMAGYMGGMVDEAVMRLTDIFLSIPGLLLTVVILVAVHAANPGVSFWTILGLIMFSFIVVWWPGYTRLVRGQVLVTREQKYVEAARASGAGTGRIIRNHIIPNSIYPVFVQISLDVGTIPLLLGALAFLGFNQAIGFGTPTNGLPTFPEWGGMAAAGVGPDFINALLTNTSSVGAVPIPWWQFLFPGLALFLFAIAVNFLSDGLRDALDPRLRR